MITEIKQIKNKANIITGEINQIQYFDEHHYVLPTGDIVPSVTKKIGDVYRKGIAFEQWLRDTGNESKLIAKEAAQRGNKKHNAIEQMIKGESIIPLTELGEDIILSKYDWVELCNWFNWYEILAKEERIKPMAIEQVVWGDVTAGKIDFVGAVDGVMSIIDWKTGKSLHMENYIQQAGYVKLWNDSAEMLELPKIEKAYLCHTGTTHKGRSKGKLHDKGIGVYEVDLEKYTRLFDLAMEAWSLMFPNYNAPILNFPLELKLTQGILKKEGKDVNKSVSS